MRDLTQLTLSSKYKLNINHQADLDSILNRNNNSYWLTTGMYPQELTIQFQQAQVVNEVRFVSSGVKKVAIEGCQTANGNGFKVIGESREIPANRG